MPNETAHRAATCNAPCVWVRAGSSTSFKSRTRVEHRIGSRSGLLGTSPGAIARFAVDFKLVSPVPGFKAPNAILLPMQCPSKGKVFLDAFLSEGLESTLVSSVGENGAQALSLSAVNNLGDVQFQDFFASGKSLYYLIYATPKDGNGSFSSSTQGATNRAVAHQYIVDFDTKGVYKKAIELPSSLTFLHLALLPSGNFLVSAFDGVNNIPRMEVLTSEGKVLRPVELPGELGDFKKQKRLKEADGIPTDVSGPMTLAKGKFTSQAAGVLYWSPGSRSVLSITGDGAAREVTIQFPKGYTLNSFVPSDGRWIAEFKRVELSTRGGDARPSSKNLLYYQIDPNDGSFLEELELKDNQVGWIACEQDSKLIGFDVDQKGNLVLMAADVPK